MGLLLEDMFHASGDNDKPKDRTVADGETAMVATRMWQPKIIMLLSLTWKFHASHELSPVKVRLHVVELATHDSNR